MEKDAAVRKKGRLPTQEYGNSCRTYDSAQKAKYRAEHTVQYTLGRMGRGKNGCSWLLVLASSSPIRIPKKSVKIVTCGEWGRADEDRSESKTSHKMPFLF